MGKFFKKIGKKEALFVFMCIFNMYIIPVYMERDIFAGWMKPEAVYVMMLPMLWMCGLGGIVQIILTAVYEFLSEKKSDSALWISLVCAVPLMLFAPFGFMYVPYFYEYCVTPALFYLMPMYAAAGMWFGRLLSGWYKGVKQFYSADKIYIGTLVFVSAVSLFYGLSFEINFAVYLAAAVLFAASIFYSRLSDFEYLTDRLARAMTAAFLLFMPLGYADFANRNIFVSYNSPHKIDFKSLSEYSANAAAIAVGIAALGVLIGYYLRIMKLGGNEQPVKRTVILKRAAFFVMAAGVYFLAVKAVNFYNEYKYWFAKSNVSVWDSLETDENDIFMLEMVDLRYSNSDESQNTMYTADKNAIGDFVFRVNMEYGIEDYDSSGLKRKECMGYKVTAYDKNYNKLFILRMDSYGKGVLEISDGYGDNMHLLLIPDQYYGKQPTKHDVYRSIIYSHRLKEKERKELISKTHENNNYTVILNDTYNSGDFTDEEKLALIGSPDTSLVILCNISKDGNAEIRKAAAKALGRPEYSGSWSARDRLIRLSRDVPPVRASAYESLSSYPYYEVIKLLYEKSKTEEDEKARFYAIISWSSAIKQHFDERSDGWLFEYSAGFYTNRNYQPKYAAERLIKEESEVCKLAWYCALVTLGKEEYKAEGKALYEKIQDEEIKEKAKGILFE